MQLSKAGASDITFHEGVILHWYLDAVGVPTIGIGFTWGSLAFRKWWAANRPGQSFIKGSTMTREECEGCLILVIADEYGLALNNFLGKDVPQNVFDAGCSVLFNCGNGALKWQWAQAMKDGDYVKSAYLLRNTAVTARGKRLAGLVARRSDEANLLKSGIYVSSPVQESTVPVATVVPAFAKPDRVEVPAKVPAASSATAAVVVAASSGGLIAYWHQLAQWIGSFF